MMLTMFRLWFVVGVTGVVAPPPPPASGWFVDPITVKISHTRQIPYLSSTKVVDVAGMRGECERVQIWSWDNTKASTNVKLVFSELTMQSSIVNQPSSKGTPFPASAWSYKQQGYVFANSTTHYDCIEDIMNNTTPTNHSHDHTCADTPQFECMTGCPNNPHGMCGGGLAPPGSCNMCACNAHNTTCPPITSGHKCLPGWYPDPLLDVVATAGIPLIPVGFTQPIYVEVCIPYGTPPGNYTGTITMSSTATATPSPSSSSSSSSSSSVVNNDVDVTNRISSTTATMQIPVKMEVWDIDLPRLNASDAFNTAFRFGSDMSSWYPTGTAQSQMWEDWMPFLAHHRVPADDIYLSAPRPIEEYVELASTGAKWMGMLDAGRPPPVAPGYVDGVIKTLTPVVEATNKLGFSNKMYVYGFDEMKQDLNESVYEIFGAIKKKWPNVTTMAVLDWQTFPADLPLDVWVDEYADYGTSVSYLQPTYKEVIRQNWLASNPAHQFWWYWCIGPADPTDMNTFIERPAIQARLLYWLTSLHAVNGMLYYDVAIWSTQCPSQRPCKPCERINNTGLTDFNPATWNGNGKSTNGGGANGDGSFTYPGPEGKPLGSTRLSNIADGIEDWQLFAKLGATTASISNAADLIIQLVTNMTSRNEDPRLLELVRRQAAHRIMAANENQQQEQQQQQK